MKLAAVVLLGGCDAVFGIAPVPDAGSPPDSSPHAIVGLAVGGFDSCALLQSGETWCWGAGQAIGSSDDIDTPMPVHVAAPAFVSLESGDAGTCGLTATGELFCWGPGGGVLGLGDTSAHPNATLAPVTDVAEVAIGFDVACLRHGDGKVECAGAAGDLGDSSVSDRDTFGPVPGIANVKQLAAGDRHACALLATGAVTCWGQNNNGQLGDGGFTAGMMPTTGPRGPYESIAASDEATCGVRSGTIDCWGSNVYDQLGYSSTQFPSSPTPVTVPTITDAIAVVGFGRGFCALRPGGVVACWGSDDAGELGDGLMVTRPVPLPVALDDIVFAISRTAAHLCALDKGSVYCWGSNNHGQLGRGVVGGSSATPLKVMGLPS